MATLVDNPARDDVGARQLQSDVAVFRVTKRYRPSTAPVVALSETDGHESGLPRVDRVMPWRQTGELETALAIVVVELRPPAIVEACNATDASATGSPDDNVTTVPAIVAVPD